MGLSCEFEKLSPSFENKMACNSSNFGNRLQMMVGIGKEYGFTLNFDIPRLFTLRKTEYRRKMANIQSDCRADLLYPRVEVEQQTHSGDEIDESLMIL